MTPYHCRLDQSTDEGNTFDATTPERAAVAYAKHLYERGEGVDDYLFYVRDPDGKLTRVLAKAEVVFTCTVTVLT